VNTRRATLGLWCLALALAAWIVFARTTISADLVAFLPRSATPTQQLLVDQLRDGVASRLVLFGIEGGTAEQRADASREFARRLQASGNFRYVNNGESRLIERDRAFLFEHRYLLSPQVTAERFTEAGLRDALQESLARLASAGGVLYQRALARDPTGEIYTVVAPLLGGAGPLMRHGVWFDASGGRALLMGETRAAGFDMDAQQAVQQSVAAAFAQARGEAPLRLLATGPSIFAVQSRAGIQQDAWRLSALAILCVAAVLLLVYRSVALFALGMLPVASGALIGVAAVSLGFGAVHGITLGFGATLIGEAIDYPTYVFTQISPGETVHATVRRVWPTLRLAMLTTVFGALAMLLSSFQGLAQLGLFSLTGVLVAGLVTRFVLPQLVRAPLRSVRAAPILGPGTAPATLLPRALVLCACALGVALLLSRGPALWEGDLANLNPVSDAARALDQQMRESMGAPDPRFMIAAPGDTREAALRHAEALALPLGVLRQHGAIDSWDSPTFYLPSVAAQTARRGALPPSATLRERMMRALDGLPFRDDLFEPFVADVEQARTGPLITLDTLAGTGLELKVRALLVESAGRWVALLPLSGVHDAAALAQAFADRGADAPLLLDLKAESNRMVAEYRNESLVLWLIGAVAVTLVLWAGLRRAGAVLAVLAPVLCAVFVTAATLALAGVKLNLFHLVSLLLILGIGVNYALFFNREVSGADESARNVSALLVCNVTTVCSFGVLAFADSPVLRSIGTTVALGAVLSLLFAWLWRRAPR
jgi:predicted exporter